jgi:putative two-component system response regulator
MQTDKRILIVDDDQNNLEILDELLGGRFFTRCVSDPAAATSVAQQLHPDIILLDVAMPGLDGLELCRRIKSQAGLASTKVILLSAHASVAHRLAGYEAGAVDYITKPFDHDEVIAKVSAWMRMVYHEQMAVIERDVEEARDACGTALVSLARFRDTETGAHLFRMRWYSLSIAEHMASDGQFADTITEAFLHDLYRASPLHDVGKVAIDDAILKKPGPLTAAEFDAMKQHTVVGEAILRQAAARVPHATYLQMAADIARSHHERIDGTGYPDGLRGVQIPLAARIVALADVFDALTSKRVYKAASPVDEAVRLIDSSNGIAFDPSVVAAFHARLNDLCAAKERFDGGVSAFDRFEAASLGIEAAGAGI